MGITFAIFILSGNTPSLIDRLNICDNAIRMLNGLDFITFCGILSQPALSLGDIFFNILDISMGFVGSNTKDLLFGCPKYLLKGFLHLHG